uniref:Putative secreted protein n=1 Tax=Amblyomma tuberculatum TaxID=48802 RepID=A0A6M2E2I6_9ACAR
MWDKWRTVSLASLVMWALRTAGLHSGHNKFDSSAIGGSIQHFIQGPHTNLIVVSQWRNMRTDEKTQTIRKQSCVQPPYGSTSALAAHLKKLFTTVPLKNSAGSMKAPQNPEQVPTPSSDPLQNSISQPP